MTKKIFLKGGSFALVDDEDFEYLSQWEWMLHRGYAQRDEYIGKIDGKYKCVRRHMHRIVNNTPEGMLTDHIDGNRLNNTRANLRTATKQQNARNMAKVKGKTSKYKGVSWNKSHGRWAARICDNAKRISLGSYDCEIEAALSYNAAAKELFSEFARLNVIKEKKND